jgi:hypothetical protein
MANQNHVTGDASSAFAASSKIVVNHVQKKVNSCCRLHMPCRVCGRGLADGRHFRSLMFGRRGFPRPAAQYPESQAVSNSDGKGQMMMRTFALAGLAAVALSAPAAAVTLVTPDVDGTYVQLESRSPGVYGVETRIGNPGNWTVGVGEHTSVSSMFAQANYNWGPQGTFHDFNLTWTASGLSFTVGSTTRTWDAPLIGNTLKIDVKGDATLVLSSLEGIGFGTLQGTGVASASNAYLFFAPSWGVDGINASGQIRVGNAVGNGSRSGVNFKVGEFTPFSGGVVPEPATWAMLIIGFGLVGASMRRRQAAIA